jgi:ribose 5-phosphate isomerase A
MTVDEAKRTAARAAIAELPEEGIIGLGSGSTAKLFIDEVGALVRSGRKLVGVPTSEASRAQATRLGIRLLGDEGPWDIDVTVDGADEVDDRLYLIKGGGGAHTREKMVNFASRRNVIVVDSTKLSSRIGEKWPVPVEVLRFAHLQTRKLLDTQGRAVLRERDGSPWITDAGNLVYDIHVGPIRDAAELDRRLREIPGVVETGLFIGRADLVLVAGAEGVRRLARPQPGNTGG